MTDRMAVVVLDAGHGGNDPGAVGPKGTREADINLAVVERIRVELERQGIRAEVTRDGDTFVSLQDRAARANAANAAVFISIHCNSAANSEAHGTEVYFCTGSRRGEALARAIHGPLIKAGGLFDRGVKGAGYYVLRHTKMPVALVELAFISNEKEERLLRDEAFQAKVAKAIAEGIMEYRERRPV
ncbi:MAG: N-acetylmuramoyl-L-alanine amidase [Bacillota bacterium]|jgi:N-acetylmuramoyl-L-alanine amidase